MSEPNRERIALLCEALESGKYTQTKRTLARLEGDECHYCCLGVACEVAKANGLDVRVEEATWSDGESSGVLAYDGFADILPPRVAQWYGIGDSPVLYSEPGAVVGVAATVLNDDRGWPFPRIAAAFRRTYGLDPAPSSPSVVTESSSSPDSPHVV